MWYSGVNDLYRMPPVTQSTMGDSLRDGGEIDEDPTQAVL